MVTRWIDEPPTSPKNEPERSEGFSPSQRLRRSADYVRCYRRGRRKHGSLLVLHVHPNDLGEARLGITASRKVGKAVVRHRIKRRIREIFRRFERRAELADLDIVAHLKPAAGASDFGSLENELERLLFKLAASVGRTSPTNAEKP